MFQPVTHLPFCLPALLRPLHIAARNGLASVVQALLSRGATVLAVDEEGAYSSHLGGVGGNAIVAHAQYLIDLLSVHFGFHGFNPFALDSV